MVMSVVRTGMTVDEPGRLEKGEAGQVGGTACPAK
jgi:hypothetical protein